MTKSEIIKVNKTLKDNECLVFVTKSCGNYILINDILVSNTGYNRFSIYNEDLTTGYSEYNITKVYKTHYGNGFKQALELNSKSYLILERKQVVELTMDQIADKFGIDVKNLKIKK